MTTRLPQMARTTGDPAIDRLLSTVAAEARERRLLHDLVDQMLLHASPGQLAALLRLAADRAMQPAPDLASMAVNGEADMLDEVDPERWDEQWEGGTR